MPGDFDLGFPEHAPNLGRIANVVSEAGTTLDGLDGVALYEPVTTIMAATDEYSRLSRQALRAPLKVVSGAMDHITELAHRAVALPSEAIHAASLALPSSHPAQLPTGGQGKHIPQPIRPPAPQPAPAGLQPWAQVFCCSAGPGAGPHMFLFPPNRPDVPPDLVPFVAFGEVDVNGNWYSASPPAGEPSATGCTVFPAVYGSNWPQVRSEINSCITGVPIPPPPPPTLPPPTPPPTPPTPPPTEPPPTPPTPPPTPAPATSCIRSADIGWSMDDCADEDCANLYTKLGIDPAQIFAGQTAVDWFNNQWSQNFGTVLDRPLQSTPEG